MSREAVIDRIVEQWDALTLFFQSEAAVVKVDSAGHTLQTINTPGTKHILLFVGYVLGKVNGMNIEFQAETFRLHKVYSSVTNQYRYLLSLFIKPEVLQSKSLADIDPADSQQHRQLAKVD